MCAKHTYSHTHTRHSQELYRPKGPFSMILDRSSLVLIYIYMHYIYIHNIQADIPKLQYLYILIMILNPKTHTHTHTPRVFRILFLLFSFALGAMELISFDFLHIRVCFNLLFRYYDLSTYIYTQIYIYIYILDADN